MDAAAQGAHLASNWVMRARVKVKTAAEAVLAYIAPRIARAGEALRTFAGDTRTRTGPYLERVLVVARSASDRADVALARIRAHVATASAAFAGRTRVLRYAAAPYAVGAVLIAGGAVMLSPALLIAGAGLSVLTYAPSHPAVVAARPARVLPPGVNFIERFHALDEQRWQVSDGWDNGYWNWSDWRRSALQPSPNGLAIIVAPNPPGASKPFAGGEMQSHDYFRYGYFEVRMRVPRGDGLVAGFFTYALPDGRPSQQEIDIEFVGARERMIEFGYHLGRHSEGQRVHLPFDATEAFHTYAFEWTPDGIRWYVDNRLTHVIADENTRRMTTPQRLYLSLSASRISAWTGEFDRSSGEHRLDVSCVAQASAYRGQSLCSP